MAAAFTRVLGRRVEHVRVDANDFRKNAPLPELVIEAISATADMARQGKYEVSDALVRQKLGRRATPLEDWIVANESAFAASA